MQTLTLRSAEDRCQKEFDFFETQYVAGPKLSGKWALLTIGNIVIVRLPPPPFWQPCLPPFPLMQHANQYSRMTCAVYRFSLWILITVCCVGCGTTKNTIATEQLLLSDAVDGAVARADFTPLVHQKVYFDTQFMKNYKGVGFVNVEYVTSSLRQQMIAAGLLLQDNAETADFVVEGRIGALGADSHEVIYGVPATSVLNDAVNAVAAVSQTPKVPGIPELALAKRSNQIAAAKIAFFAYERETRERVWQSGMLTGRSTAKDLWVLGAGPFQRGSIHDGNVKFAGSSLDVPYLDSERSGSHGPIASFKKSTIFTTPEAIGQAKLEAAVKEEQSEIQQVSAEEPDESEAESSDNESE